MAYRNFINIEQSVLDKPIYRIMPIHRLLEALQKKQLVLVTPKKWDDPFENALLSAPVKLVGTGEVGAFSAKDAVYGQCWTLHRETDAMWRIYSPDKNGAKVKTTPRKLLEALKADNPDFWELRCFVGQVTYLTQAKLLSKLLDINWRDTNGSGIAESLLYKRREFSHEKEVRVIYSGADNSTSSEIHPFKILPNDLFEEVIFDPRMDKELATAYKLAIRAKGFTNRIDRSSLYQRPKGLEIRLQPA